MKRLLCILAVVLAASSARAWENPGHRRAQRFLPDPAGRRAEMVLRADRVEAVEAGGEIRYDLGGRSIRIQPDGHAARRFARQVRAGRASSRARVSLAPDRRSPFNRRFKAESVRHH